MKLNIGNNQLAYIYTRGLLKICDAGKHLDDDQFLKKTIREMKIKNRIEKIEKLINKINGL